MKFDSWYRIEYGFFFKERFLGVLKSIQPSSLETEVFELSSSGNSGEFLVRKTKYSDKEIIKEILHNYKLTDVISYGFSLENGVLKEVINNQSNLKQPSYTITSHLTPLKQDLFLKNIFKYFGVYLALFVKDHDFHLTDQEYILEELKEIIEKHSSFSTSCGDYTFIYQKDKLGVPESVFLGISARFDANTMNELDKRKGVTLIIYRDDETKTKEYQDNFVVNAKTFKRFGAISKEDANVCHYVQKALNHEKKELDLLYHFHLDYPEIK